MSGGYYLRAVEEADRELLFEWANDEETRRESFSQAPITWEEHAAWFARTQADEACRHWILMVPGGRQERMAQGRGAGTETVAAENAERTGSGQTPAEAYPAGVLRLKREESGAYCLSYSIAPAYRGHGYGTILLGLAKTWMIAECPDCVKIYGEVKAENTASVRCFERAGYERTADETAANQSVFRFYADLTRENVLYFRADGGGETGIGHLMRCFTIADACRERGMQAVFVAADEGAEAMTLERGYPCRVLNTDYRDMNSELPKLLPVLRECAPVVLDSYFLTEPYVNALRGSGHPVVWMDDLAEQEFSVDIRINYNLYAEHAERPEDGEGADDRGKAEGCLELLGPSYAPVRPSFLRTGAFVRERIGKVLVLTGGSDPLGAGLFFARLLTKQLPDAEIFVVIGPYAEGKEALRSYAEQEKRIELMEGCSDLSEIMQRCDLAVTAAGSTLYELCASGLPGIVYYIADNQRMGAEAFARRTGAANLGDFRSDSFRAEAEKKLEAALRGLYTESGRQNLAKRMKELVDGHGAVRIAEKLKELAEKYET